MRKLLVALLCALLIASGATVMATGGSDGNEWGIASPYDMPSDRATWWPDRLALEGAREAGIQWLLGEQASDGTWDSDFGVTGLAAFALALGGRDANHPALSIALSLLLEQAQEDGSFSEGTYVHYYTSLAIMALSAAGRTEDEAAVSAGVAFLVRDQCDGDEEGFEEWWRGGIGYGGDGRPDMSNTQFALMALVAATEAYPDIQVPRETWQDALVFLHRCQNLPSLNDLDWDDDPSSPSFADGGFIYYPGRSNAGGLASYGSVTAAGIWCLLAAGEDVSSEATAAALGWLGANFAANENPGFGDPAYFYYAWALARALRTAGAPALVSGNGDTIHWARDLATAIIARQAIDGSWTNTESDSYWEGHHVVATTFALLALEAMLPAEDAGLLVRSSSGAKVSVMDQHGRRDAEIPGWSRDPEGVVTLGDAGAGPFVVVVKGSDTLEVATDAGGTVRLWRSVGLAREGGKATLDLAPLLGPSSLVVSGVEALPKGGDGSEPVPSGGLVVVLAAVVTLAAISALASRRRLESGR